MRGMRVVVVNDFARINGGAGKMAIDSAVALAREGIPVHFFAAALETDASMRDVPNLTVTALGLTEVNAMPARQKLLGGVWRPEVERAFREVLAGHDPAETVVHIHSLRDANTVATMRPLYEGGFRWVFTAHDYMIACPYSGFYDHELKAVCTRKPMGLACVTSRCNGGSRAARMWFLGRFLVQTGPGGMPRRMRHVITVGDFSRRVLQPFFPAGVRVHPLYYGIEVEREARVEAERNGEAIFVGRLSGEKDPVTFARAAIRAGMRPVFVGGGEEEEAVRAACREEGGEAEFTGWVTPAGVRERLRGARALVFPSVWYEVHPISVQEAIAMGVPVLASTASSASDMVAEFGCGATFAPRDVEGLAGLLRGLSDAGAVEGWSRSAYEGYWASPRTMARHVEGLKGIYAEILAEA